MSYSSDAMAQLRNQMRNQYDRALRRDIAQGPAAGMAAVRRIIEQEARAVVKCRELQQQHRTMKVERELAGLVQTKTAEQLNLKPR